MLAFSAFLGINIHADAVMLRLSETEGGMRARLQKVAKRRTAKKAPKKNVNAAGMQCKFDQAPEAL